MSAIGVAFRQLKPFQRCLGGKHKANQGGLAPRHRQRPPTYRDPFFPSLVPESHCKNRHSIHYSSSCPKKYIYMYSIGDTAMVIVKFRLRWPHTWRYALHSLSRPTMTSGRLGWIYSRSSRRTHNGEVLRGSLNKFRPILEVEFVLFHWK